MRVDTGERVRAAWVATAWRHPVYPGPRSPEARCLGNLGIDLSSIVSWACSLFLLYSTYTPLLHRAGNPPVFISRKTQRNATRREALYIARTPHSLTHSLALYIYLGPIEIVTLFPILLLLLLCELALTLSFACALAKRSIRT